MDLNQIENKILMKLNLKKKRLFHYNDVTYRYNRKLYLHIISLFRY